MLRLNMTAFKSFLMKQPDPFTGRPVPPTLSQLTRIRKLNLESSNSPKWKASLTSPLSFPNSRLKTLAPEFDPDSQLIRVGGRLRQCHLLSPDILHPIVLDPIHPVTKLLIKQYDTQLHHPGTERSLLISEGASGS